MQKVLVLISTILLTGQLVFANAGVEIDVKLSPAGSFKAKTDKIKGLAKQKGSSVISSQVLVDLRTLKTGIELRDKHLKKRLLVDNHPVAKLLNAKGKDGKGEAMISLMGQEKKVMGTYTTKGKFLVSEFKMKLSELGIDDVNYMGVGVKDEVIVRVTVPVQQVTDSAQRDLTSEKGK
jgi:hypothetical protein